MEVEIVKNKDEDIIGQIRDISDTKETYLDNLRKAAQDFTKEIFLRGLDLGYVLVELKNEKRYKFFDYETWNAFTQAEFNLSGRHCNRLVKMAELDNLDTVAEIERIGPAKADMIHPYRKEKYFGELVEAAKENSRSDLKATITDYKREENGVDEQPICDDCHLCIQEKDTEIDIKNEGSFQVGSKGMDVCYRCGRIVSSMSKDERIDVAESCGYFRVI